MLRLIKKCCELRFSGLMEVYEEANRKNGEQHWPNRPRNEQILRAEQDFYQYLQKGFFDAEGAYYALWEENGRYLSALRLEPYEDGMLLEGLETRPDCRCRGYGTRLLQAVLGQETRIVYSHVSRGNVPSLQVHQKCGFQKILDYAVYIDGSVSNDAITLCKKL